MVHERKLIKTEKELLVVSEFINDCETISIDTENGGPGGMAQALNPRYCIPAGYSICVKKDNTYYSYYFPINHLDIKTKLNTMLGKLMEGKKIIIMHNSPYDASIFAAQYDYDIFDKFWFDTMVGQHLIDEASPKGLKKITKRYFNVEQKEFNWDDITQISSDAAYKYACDDAYYTYKHFERQVPQLKEEQLMDLYKNIEEPFQKVLVHMKLNGITFNSDKCKELENKLLLRKKELIDEIVKVTPQIQTSNSLFDHSKKLNINLGSADDLKKLLYDKLNLPVKGKTESGAPAVDTPTLKRIKDEHPIIPLLIEYKEIMKILSSYTKSLYEKVWDGMIYPDFNDTGTTSSRLSSNNPNFQQLPKTFGVRGFFEVSNGYKMYVADFSQEELRICGVVTKSETFRNVYKKGQDLHLKVANDIWKLGIRDEDLLEDSPNYKMYKDKFNKERYNAKSINFGLMYGRTAHGLQNQLGGTVEECQMIVDEYFKTFPEIDAAIKNTANSIKMKGFTRNLFGRKRRFSKFKGKYYTQNVFRQAFNFRIQGSCADILRIVMNNILKYINTLDDPSEVKMIGTVHDEILYEIKDNQNFNKHKNKIKYIMENSVNFDIKLTADGEVGNNYGECK